MLLKHSITSRKYTITYCQTLEEIPWPLRLGKPEKKTFKKIAKI